MDDRLVSRSTSRRGQGLLRAAQPARRRARRQSYDPRQPASRARCSRAARTSVRRTTAGATVRGAPCRGSTPRPVTSASAACQGFGISCIALWCLVSPRFSHRRGSPRATRPITGVQRLSGTKAGLPPFANGSSVGTACTMYRLLSYLLRAIAGLGVQLFAAFLGLQVALICVGME